MAFELTRLVRQAAGAFGTRMAETARALRRRAHAEAGRVWRDVGEILQLGSPPEPSTASSMSRPEVGNSEPNSAIGPATCAVIATMAEVLSRSGYRDVRADIPGFAPPDLVAGTVRSHRPNLTAVGGNRTVLLDVFLPTEVALEEHISRWHLFSSAADQAAGEFHIVVPSWLEGQPGREWVRHITDAIGMRVRKVWEF